MNNEHLRIHYSLVQTAIEEVVRRPTLFQPIEQVGEGEVQMGADEDDDDEGDSWERFYQHMSQQSLLLPSLAAAFSFPRFSSE